MQDRPARSLYQNEPRPDGARARISEESLLSVGMGANPERLDPTVGRTPPPPDRAGLREETWIDAPIVALPGLAFCEYAPIEMTSALAPSGSKRTHATNARSTRLVAGLIWRAPPSRP
jgi:hypothetical protein